MLKKLDRGLKEPLAIYNVYIGRFIMNQSIPNSGSSISRTGRVGGRTLRVNFVHNMDGNEKGIWPEWTFPNEPP